MGADSASQVMFLTNAQIFGAMMDNPSGTPLAGEWWITSLSGDRWDERVAVLWNGSESRTVTIRLQGEAC